MRVIGLIGNKLGHSFSKSFFTDFWKEQGLDQSYRYENFELESIENLPDLIHRNPELIAFNVTIPFKEDILRYCEWQDVKVKQIQAANTVLISRSLDGFRLMAFNTDCNGFEATLLAHPIPEGSQALVLGDGGAAKAVKYVLSEKAITFRIVSRKPNSHYSWNQLDASIIRQHKIIINTTPLGMYPEQNACPPIPYEAISSDHRLIDLIYNPEMPLFLRKGEERGAIIQNGIQMLRVQAEAAWFRFSNLESNQIIAGYK